MSYIICKCGEKIKFGAYYAECHKCGEITWPGRSSCIILKIYDKKEMEAGK